MLSVYLSLPFTLDTSSTGEVIEEDVMEGFVIGLSLLFTLSAGIHGAIHRDASTYTALSE